MNAASISLETAGPRVTTALIALGVLGVSVFLSMPVVVAALAQEFSFTDRQIGQFSFVQLSFVSLGSVLSLFLVRRFSVRVIAMGSILTLIVADLVTPGATAYPVFLTLRAIAGMAGGVAVAVATGALGKTARADKNFGWFLLTQIVFQMAANALLPQLSSAFGLYGVFTTFVVLEVLVLALLIGSLPTVLLAEGRSTQGANTAGAWLQSGLVLLSILTFFMAIGALWTFVGRIGETKGLTPHDVGEALSIAGIGGLIGAFLPAVIGARLGRVLPIVLALAGLLGGIFLLQSAQGTLPYILAAASFSFGWFLLYPYQLGTLASIDRDGRPMIASAALTGIGLGIGPALVSRMIDRGLDVSYSISSICVVLAGALILGVLASSRTRSQPS